MLPSREVNMRSYRPGESDIDRSRDGL